MMRRLVLVVAIVAAGCSRDTIEVNKKPSDDYKHAVVVGAVDKFVAAGRTPDAFAEMAQTLQAARPQMDRTVAREAELKLVTLAIHPIQQLQAKSMREKIDALALTVWPSLLGPSITADKQLEVKDPKAPEIVPKPGEDPDQYLVRLCGGPLARECKSVVPELQGDVIEALALRRGMERARNAVTECLACRDDDAWKQTVRAWEKLDAETAETISNIERQADPDNWPVAGAAADDDPSLPEAEFSTRGDLIVGGHSYGPNQQRIQVLEELRGNGEVLALHFHPDTTLAQMRALLVDARKAGAKRVAVIAREPFYPYARKAYWVADGYGLRANLRPTDSLQLLLHAIDEVAGPGTVARVD
ncbi:MAG TPA: hypothetical protein VFV99_11060 [Kofleriaceae bacterium]|nr:hypothetical protein [Kofleriaceae bacterium]